MVKLGAFQSAQNCRYFCSHPVVPGGGEIHFRADDMC